jgi:hypothetical protein
MRVALLAAVVAAATACGGSTVAPGAVSASTTISVAGSWSGTLASSNNATVQVGMTLTQSGAEVQGSWQSSTVSWSGDVIVAVSGSAVNGTFTFAGTTSSGEQCSGTAAVSGNASDSTLTLTSPNGVVGPPCPARLPVGIAIELRRQS